MEIVDVMTCFVLKFSVKLEKATSITAILVSQDHLSSFCSTDVQANDEISIIYIFLSKWDHSIESSAGLLSCDWLKEV